MTEYNAQMIMVSLQHCVLCTPTWYCAQCTSRSAGDGSLKEMKKSLLQGHDVRKGFILAFFLLYMDVVVRIKGEFSN